jgi:hypothetical protein
VRLPVGTEVATSGLQEERDSHPAFDGVRGSVGYSSIFGEVHQPESNPDTIWFRKHGEWPGGVAAWSAAWPAPLSVRGPLRTVRALRGGQAPFAFSDVDRFSMALFVWARRAALNSQKTAVSGPGRGNTAARLRVPVAADVEVVLTPPCIFHS